MIIFVVFVILIIFIISTECACEIRFYDAFTFLSSFSFKKHYLHSLLISVFVVHFLWFSVSHFCSLILRHLWMTVVFTVTWTQRFHFFFIYFLNVPIRGKYKARNDIQYVSGEKCSHACTRFYHSMIDFYFSNHMLFCSMKSNVGVSSVTSSLTVIMITL